MLKELVDERMKAIASSTIGCSSPPLPDRGGLLRPARELATRAFTAVAEELAEEFDLPTPIVASTSRRLVEAETQTPIDRRSPTPAPTSPTGQRHRRRPRSNLKEFGEATVPVSESPSSLTALVIWWWPGHEHGVYPPRSPAGSATRSRPTSKRSSASRRWSNAFPRSRPRRGPRAFVRSPTPTTRASSSLRTSGRPTGPLQYGIAINSSIPGWATTPRRSKRSSTERSPWITRPLADQPVEHFAIGTNVCRSWWSRSNNQAPYRGELDQPPPTPRCCRPPWPRNWP